MRRSILLLAFAVAAPLSASWWPVWTPDFVQLEVGQTTTVRVQARWSGLVDYGNGIHWTFESDNNHVASASFYLGDPGPHDVQIVGNSPGMAAIHQANSIGSLDPQEWVVIKVVCGVEPPVRPAAAVLQGRLGQPVTVTALSDIAARTSFTWYLGREGDRSHPLDAIGPKAAITPRDYGTQYAWVSAVTPCSASSAEFRIETAPPRGRAVRR